MRRGYFSKIVLSLIVLMFALGGAAWAAEEGKVNINTASAEELMTLQGVGEAIAARIIAYRETNGPFEKPLDIMKVKGIGQKTFDANESRIVVE